MSLSIIVTIAAVLLLSIVAAVVFIRSCYRQVPSGQALVISRIGPPRVILEGGALVLPIVHKAERLDVTTHAIEINRLGKEGLICRDNIRADIKARFFVRINRMPEDVLAVAQRVGAERSSDLQVLEELFAAKFSEALKAAAKQLSFSELVSKRLEFKDMVIELIGRDLNGWVLDDLVIDYLEQTPIEHLDPNNVLDAEGIRKIQEKTAESHNRIEEVLRMQRAAASTASLGAEETADIFELPNKVDVTKFVPGAALAEAPWEGQERGDDMPLTLSYQPTDHRLEVRRQEATVCVFQLDQPFDVKLGFGSDLINVRLRQRRRGLELVTTVRLSTTEILQQASDVKEAMEAMKSLPQQSVDAPVLQHGGAKLLATLRHYHGLHGGQLQTWT